MEFDKKQTEAWIVEMQNGNFKVYEEFYKEWYPRTFYIALAITQNEADAKDAAQDTMIQIHSSIKDLRDIGYFKLWLNRIVISKCNRIFRKRKSPVMSESQLDTLQNQIEKRGYLLPVDESHKQSDELVLSSLIQHLSPIYREVLALMYFEQLSIKEITEILRIPEGTVKSRLNAARTKLRDEVEAYEQASGIPLDFHGVGFDAILVSAYAAFASSKTVALSLAQSTSIGIFQLPKKFSTILKSNWLSSVGIASFVGVSAVCGGMVYRSYESQKIKDDNSLDIVQDVRKSNFKETTFKDMSIHNPKDAYFILMKYAHCEDEIDKLNENEKNAIQEIYKQLEDNSDIYTNLYNNSKK